MDTARFLRKVLLSSLSGFLLPSFSGAASTSVKSYDELTQLIEDRAVRSIEDLLPLLPESLRRNYTLIHSSRSLQGSSHQDPRVILFNADGSLIMTFNGNARQKRFDRLEVLEYSSHDDQARLFEIDFSQSGKNRFSKANPAVCLECHASYPRPQGAVKPIWPEYSSWHGAYGESDDAMTKEEEEKYVKFLTAAAGHPRYKWLLRDSHIARTAPYYPDYIRSDDRVESAPYKEGATYWSSRNIRFMPNLRLSKILDLRNGMRLARQIVNHPQFPRMAHSTLYTLECQSYQQKFNPPGVRRVSSRAYGIDPNNFHIGFADDRAAYNSGAEGLFSASRVISYHALKKLVEMNPELAPYLIPTSLGSYSNSFGIHKQGEDYLRTPTGRYIQSWTNMLTRTSPLFSRGNVIALDPNAKKTVISPLLDQFCETLAKGAVLEAKQGASWEEPDPKGGFNSFRSFKKEVRDSLPVDDSTVTRILQSCASCHERTEKEGRFAPWIPFGDMNKLRGYVSGSQIGEDNLFIDEVALRTSPKALPSSRGGKQMPLGRKTLSDEEREIFVKFLKSLAH